MISCLEDELSVSALKREAAKLYDQLAAVQVTKLLRDKIAPNELIKK